MMEYVVKFDLPGIGTLVYRYQGRDKMSREDIISAAVPEARRKGLPLDAEQVTLVLDSWGTSVLPKSVSNDLERRKALSKHLGHEIVALCTGSWYHDVAVDLEDNRLELSDYEEHDALERSFYCNTCDEDVSAYDLGMEEGYETW